MVAGLVAVVGRWELATDAVETKPSVAPRNVIASSERDFPFIAIVEDVVLIGVFSFFIEITAWLLMTLHWQAAPLSFVATNITSVSHMSASDSPCNGFYINRYTAP